MKSYIRHIGWNDHIIARRGPKKRSGPDKLTIYNLIDKPDLETLFLYRLISF
jgi:hypothetical protein